MQVEFVAATEKYHDALILPIFAEQKLSKAGEAYNTQHDGLIGKILDQETKFTGKLGEILPIPTVVNNKATRIILLGMGEEGALTTLNAETAGAKLAAFLNDQKLSNFVLDITGSLSETFCAALANGFLLRAYQFEHYKSKSDKTAMQVLHVACGQAVDTVRDTYSRMKAITEAVHWARDLSNEPPNALNPVTFAERISETMKPLGVKVKIIDQKALTKMEAGGILGVGQGSETPPCLVVMEYAGSGKKSAKDKKWPTALVGKGITFDTGGYSLKPPAAQIDMKFDMCGAATVVGTVRALAAIKAEQPVVGIVALAENMVDSTAYRVNDILKTLSGQTVEVLNTDAEGRLVLADALTYVQDKYDPGQIIDVATLTGAAMIALGMEYGAAFCNDDALFNALNAASETCGEKIWRMPLDEIFDKEMKGTIADLRNIGKGRWGGSCTAAAFLKQFVDDGRKWAHLDIAGTPYSAAATTFAPIGANGYGVRLLTEALTAG